MDARKFIRNTQNKYQVLIVDVPAPTTAQLNRYFTVEFLMETRQILDHDGIITLHLPSSSNYMSPELIKSHSSLFNTMQRVFEHVMIIPGTMDFFLASNQELSFDVLEPLLEKDIKNDYVNAYYYVPELTRMRSEKITETLNPGEKVNTDLRPRAYLIQLNYWLSHFKGNLWYMGIIITILALLAIIASNRINKALFVSGFTGASMTFILIVCFQVLYGYVYQMTGILITMFMGGLAAGALLLPGILTPGIKPYRIFQFIIAMLVIATPMVVIGLSRAVLPEFVTVMVLNLISLFCGILIGYQFTQAARLQESSAGRVAASTYGVDLAGSTVGSLTTSILLVPLVGISITCFILAALNILVSFVIPRKQIKA
jgi:spermidine synthase